MIGFCSSAESWTGGLLAALITTVPRSSDVFDRGFVTYSNAAKVECLGVSPGILEIFGAVSGEAAKAMAEGAIARSNADISLSITGIAGPAGGTTEKPIGVVYFCLGKRSGVSAAAERHFGILGRDAVRYAAIATSVELLLEAVAKNSGGPLPSLETVPPA